LGQPQIDFHQVSTSVPPTGADTPLRIQEIYEHMRNHPHAYYIFNIGSRPYTPQQKFWNDTTKFVIDIPGETPEQRKDYLSKLKQFLMEEPDFNFDPKQVTFIKDSQGIPAPLSKFVLKSQQDTSLLHSNDAYMRGLWN